MAIGVPDKPEHLMAYKHGRVSDHYSLVLRLTVVLKQAMQGKFHFGWIAGLVIAL